jgi:hypothetical protein
MQPGLFDDEDRLAKLEKLGDPLPHLDSIVDWAAFRPLLKVIHQKQRKSNAGRKPHDVTLMFKSWCSRHCTTFRTTRPSSRSVTGCRSSVSSGSRRKTPSPMPRRSGCSASNWRATA